MREKTRLGSANDDAKDIKKAVDSSRDRAPDLRFANLTQPRGDLAELVVATDPDVHLRELIAPSNSSPDRTDTC